MPTPAFLAAINNVALAPPAGASSSLLHGDGTDGSTTFTDEYAHTWTRNGTSTTISHAQAKFGDSSIAIGSGGQTGGGTNNGITTANTSDLLLGLLPFTVDFQQYWRSLNAYQTALSKGGTGGQGLLLQTGNGDGKYGLYVSGGLLFAESVAATVNVWTQYRLTRDVVGANDVWTLTRDGVVTGTTLTTHVNLGNTGSWAWGAYEDGTYATDSYLDELRIRKGEALAWEAQTAPWAD